ncbi:hypothetical protein FBUS_02998 [Fasciolopsis buskii]|uniref:Snake toxin/toxin-like domain-containing protein n=1 Tax=Fasciolopsis buskii TaxID=27845 RepID=A0A8E0RNT7_9TREM|nr:hypothetical protein FBUS_02998 [Fasciolopsis buski]
MQSRQLNRNATSPSIIQTWLLVLCMFPSVFSVRCRTCLPCEEEYKAKFLLRKDEIVDNCKVCITAETEYQGYKIQGRACMQRCPDQRSQNTKPGMHDKITCCYQDLCNNRALARNPHLVLTSVTSLLTTYGLLARFR